MTTMYHSTSSDNRKSILKHGLLRSKSDAAQMGGYGGIFLYSGKPHLSGGYIDTWAVDTTGLTLELDDPYSEDPEETWWVTWSEDIGPYSEDPEETWWVTWSEDIGPERLKLVHRGKTAKITN